MQQKPEKSGCNCMAPMYAYSNWNLNFFKKSLDQIIFFGKIKDKV